MKYLSVLLPLLALPASAQPAPPPPVPMPASIGAPHICTNDYPPEAVAAHAEGVTILGFIITESGRTDTVKVVRSSGNDALDAAAVTCAGRWLYRPAMQNGKPVAVPWKAEVRWALHVEDAIYAPIPIAAPHDCSSFAPAGVAIPPGAVTTVQFHVTADGKVTNVAVVATSGNRELDRAALHCAAEWTYHPARMGDQPVEVSWRENVAWK